MVGHLDDVEIVLDDEDSVPRVDELLQHLNQLVDVRHVQSCRRLVEDIERPAGRPLRKLRRQLHALRLTAGERRRALPQLDIPESHVDERLDAVSDLRQIVEEAERLLRRHVENICDALALVEDLERLTVIPLPVADLTRNIDVREEVHLDLHKTIARACLAPAALCIEREPARAIAARPRV